MCPNQGMYIPKLQSYVIRKPQHGAFPKSISRARTSRAFALVSQLSRARLFFIRKGVRYG